MRYLIKTNDLAPFFTEWYIYENHYNIGMIVYDLFENKYTTDGITWMDIEIDHL